MRIEGDYRKDGYAMVRGLVPVDVARAFMAQLKQALPPGPVVPAEGDTLVLKREAKEIYGGDFPFMLTFLWGLTPAIEQVVGRPLVPSYCFFRIYREGDILRVHSDRPACEHSVSLTLDYSDDVPWPLEVSSRQLRVSEPIAEDFGADAYSSLAMQVGDAVAYNGTHHRHGRITPNPNGWSAHLFLHWVDPKGPFADCAFDGAGAPRPVNFTFA